MRVLNAALLQPGATTLAPSSSSRFPPSSSPASLTRSLTLKSDAEVLAGAFMCKIEAEVAMRADGKPGMSDEEVLDFVSRYLPAYKAYLPVLYSGGPKGMDPKRLLAVEIDEERNPLPEKNCLLV